MDVVQLLGANVRHHRKLKGLSQERLALDAGMERSYVSDLERGTRNPSVRALGRLADALGIDAQELLKRHQCCHTLYKIPFGARLRWRQSGQAV